MARSGGVCSRRRPPRPLTGPADPWESDALVTAIREEFAAARRTAVHTDGALDDVSTLVLPLRGIRFAEGRLHPSGGAFGSHAAVDSDGELSDGGDFGGTCSDPAAAGMQAHSKAYYPAQWEPGGKQLRRARPLPGTPLPEDSLSAMGAAAVALALATEHGVESPGFWNRLTEGDIDRPNYQGDVGSEKINLANIGRLIRRVYRATLPEGDPKRELFETCATAEAQLELLAKLLPGDNLHAQLHNGMAIVKALLQPHWHVASLSVLKLSLKMKACLPSKEGQAYARLETASPRPGAPRARPT